MHELVTVKEVAEILKISYESALYIIKYDELPYIQVGRQFRVDKKDLEAYLHKRKIIHK